MLDEMTPEAMDEWIAFAMVEPFGDQWRQTATIAAQVNNSAAASKNSLVTPDDYLPEPARSDKQRHGGLMAPEDYEQIAAVKWGV